MRRWLRVLQDALRRPNAALWGVREFRSSWTKSYDSPEEIEAYDAGRELAHALTLRRFEEN